VAKKTRKGSAGQTTRGLGATGFNGFTPWTPPPPPTGSYDPSLNQQLGASQRGIEDLRQDVATGNLRAGVDYGLDRDDILRSRGRGYADLDRSSHYAAEDLNSQTAALQRSYAQLQRRQAEGSRASGVLSQGLALQAAQKRAENYAIDRAPMVESWRRAQTQNQISRDRLTEDTDQGLGRLDLGYQRGWQDRNLTQLPRAEREAAEFGLDVDEMKGFQASQYGWEPAGMPKGMGTNRQGKQYIDRPEGNFIVRYDQFGNVLSKRRRRGSGGQVPYGTMIGSSAGGV
jgi:hypothetical protein